MARAEETYGGLPSPATGHRCGPQREVTLHQVTFHYNTKFPSIHVHSKNITITMSPKSGKIQKNAPPQKKCRRDSQLTVGNFGFCPKSDRLLH